MKKILLYKILEIFYNLGAIEAAFILRSMFKENVIILMFHRVSHGDAIGLPTISITTDNYDKLINLLQKNFNVVALEDIVNIFNNKQPFSRPSIVLTFDDAYEEVYHDGVAALQRHSLPATIFPVVNALEVQIEFWWDIVYAFLRYASFETPIEASFYNYLSDEHRKIFDHILGLGDKDRPSSIMAFIEKLKCLSANSLNEIAAHLLSSYNDYLREYYGHVAKTMNLRSLQELANAGWTIGSHTMTHQFLNNIAADEINNEVHQSKGRLEKMIGRKVISFAYPSGIYNKAVVQRVVESKYEMAVTTNHGANSRKTSLHELKRINVWDGFVCDNNGIFSESLTLLRLFAST